MEHIASLMHLLRIAKKEKKELYALLLDLRAAYDTVSHTKLWAVLERAGVSTQIVGYLQRLYNSSSVYVKRKSS